MSLTNFLNESEVKERIRPYRLKKFGRIPETRVVPPDTLSAPLIGTAFDYLLRFELERRVKRVNSQAWIATQAFEGIRRRLATTETGRLKRKPHPFYLQSKELHDNAVNNYRAFIASNAPTNSMLLEVAASCIDLARFDLIYRAGIDSEILKPKRKEDIDDLIGLLAGVDSCPDFDEMLKTELWLNPQFGLGSDLVCGADADIISGDMLIDVKTTIKPSVSGKHLDQLLGYFLLSRFARLIDPDFPVLNWCALYFSRQAFLLQFPVVIWTDQPGFSEMENWFIAAAFKYHKYHEEFLHSIFGRSTAH